MMQVDIFLFQAIHGFSGKNNLLDAAGVFFAEYAEYILLGGLAIFLAINTKKYWPIVWQGFVAAVLARFFIAESIRFFWARPRPFVGADFLPLVQGENPFNSFPSGHATFYFTLAIVVYLYNKKAGLIFLAASFLISIARIFVGVHWPTDILGGAAIGIICGWIVWRLLRK